MDGIGPSDFGRRNQVGNSQVGLAAGWRSDAHIIIGETYVQRLAIGLTVHRHGLHIELATGAYHPKCNLTPIGNEDLLKHDRPGPGTLPVASARRGAAPPS